MSRPADAGTRWRLVATCTRGLEEVLAGELSGAGVVSPKVERGAVSFDGAAST